MNQNENSEI